MDAMRKTVFRRIAAGHRPGTLDQDGETAISTDDADLVLQAYDFVGEATEWSTTVFSANDGVAAVARGDLTGDERPDHCGRRRRQGAGLRCVFMTR